MQRQASLGASREHWVKMDHRPARLLTCSGKRRASLPLTGNRYRARYWLNVHWFSPFAVLITVTSTFEDEHVAEPRYRFLDLMCRRARKSLHPG